MSTRKQFEADIRAKCHSEENADQNLVMNENGFYNDQRVQYMWVGWQAALAAHQLTDEQIDRIAKDCEIYQIHDNGRPNRAVIEDFARAIESAVRGTP